jgi:ComF family protein
VLRPRLARALGRLVELIDLIVPRPCLGCGELASAPLEVGLCPRCRARLEPCDPRASCRGCLRPLVPGAGGGPLCGACRADPPLFAGARALWQYRPPLDAVVRAFKFRGCDFLGAELARAGLVRLSPEDLGGPEIVVPVPLPWTRRLVRGFNQAERFGRPLARALGVPFLELLSRPAFAGRQARRVRADRLRRGTAGFGVRRARPIRARRVLLVDDVFTTGATARSAAECLVGAGAAQVVVLVVAWTPLEPPFRLS